jgi:hypothetical protein
MHSSALTLKKSNETILPWVRWGALALAMTLAATSAPAPTQAAEHPLSRITFDAARRIDVLDMVMSVDWDFDAPPSGTDRDGAPQAYDRAFISNIIRQSALSTFIMTEGRMVVGTVRVYRNSQFMTNTDIQYLQRNGRANAHVGGFMTGCRSCRVQQYAGTSESTDQHGKTVAHEFGHYVLGQYDEYREVGGTSTNPGFPQDGDTPRDSIMHNHLQFENLSTADDYLDINGRSTAQFRIFGRSHWEVLTAPSPNEPEAMTTLRQQYRSLAGLPTPTRATLTRPRTGWENDLRIVFMADGAVGDAAGTPAPTTAAAAPAGVIQTLVIDTTDAAALPAQLRAAAQAVDSAEASTRLQVMAHPFSLAPVIGFTLLNEAGKAAVKAAIAAITADTATDDASLAQRLFAYAEAALPALFPAGPATQSANGFLFRVYGTQAIGVNGGNFFYFNGQVLQNLGPGGALLAGARTSLSATLNAVLGRVQAVRTVRDTPSVMVFTGANNTVEPSLSDAFRNAGVPISAVALTSAGQPPAALRSGAGTKSLFDLAKDTRGVYKDANKPGDLARAAEQAANAAEGDDVEQIQEASASSLPTAGNLRMSATVADATLDKEVSFTAYFDPADAAKLAFTLTTPGGLGITPTSLPAGVSYVLDATNGEARYRVATTVSGRVGVWQATLTANAAVTSEVALDAQVQSALYAVIDVTGGTAEDPKPIRMEVEVAGPVPVQGAVVTADVFDRNGTRVRTGLVLKDDGAAPDVRPNDGRYTISLTDLPNGEYDVVVTAINNGQAVYTTAGSTKQGVNAPPQAVPAFQRRASETFIKTR